MIKREIFFKRCMMKLLLQLYAAFFRVGALTFGGGYSMMPMLEKETVEKYHWVTKEQLLDYFAAGQCLPGLIAVNSATFIGNAAAGAAGSAAAILGVISPSYIIITLIAAFLKNFQDLAVVGHAFGGIRIAVAALIVSTCIKMFKTSVKDAVTFIIFLAVFALSVFADLSAIWYVIAAGVVGVSYNYIRGKGWKSK